MTGDPPPLVKRIGLPDMVAYAGATWDWHRIHYDAEYLTSRQLPAPVVDGQMLGALLAGQILSWATPEWRLAQLSFRFAELVFAGETVRCELRVDSRTDTTITLVGTVSVEGDRPRVAMSKAAATLVRR
jgi:acyl dehydratase